MTNFMCFSQIMKTSLKRQKRERSKYTSTKMSNCKYDRLLFQRSSAGKNTSKFAS